MAEHSSSTFCLLLPWLRMHTRGAGDAKEIPKVERARWRAVQLKGFFCHLHPLGDIGRFHKTSLPIQQAVFCHVNEEHRLLSPFIYTQTRCFWGWKKRRKTSSASIDDGTLQVCLGTYRGHTGPSLFQFVSIQARSGMELGGDTQKVVWNTCTDICVF